MAGGAGRVAMTGAAASNRIAQRRDARPPPPWEPRAAGPRPSGGRRGTSAAPQSARRFTLTGLGAVAFIFVITLVVATLESVLGIGLRSLTLIALAGSTLLAGLWVRRSDIATIVVAPPLVFALVVSLEIGLAPTLAFTPTVLASLLVRGFPTMGIATAIALLVCGYRLVKHR
ncbi:MAG: hypothetical protein H0X18_01295 [Geodermatophilaceae bacterium]|nr:hypothetical protein [Geodermatophilaceae bacterium]